MKIDVREGIEQKTNPVKAIREKCRDCCNGSITEIDACTVSQCQLHPFRFGKNPFRTKRELTDEQKKAAAVRLANARTAKIA